MKAYALMYESDYDHHELVDIYESEEAAKNDRPRVAAAYGSHPRYFIIEEYEMKS